MKQRPLAPAVSEPRDGSGEPPLAPSPGPLLLEAFPTFLGAFPHVLGVNPPVRPWLVNRAVGTGIRGAGGKWGSGRHQVGLGGKYRCTSAELEEVNGPSGAVVGSGGYTG